MSHKPPHDQVAIIGPIPAALSLANLMGLPGAVTPRLERKATIVLEPRAAEKKPELKKRAGGSQ